MSLVQVSTSFANTGAPGYKDNPERWMAARITASHMNTMLQLIKKTSAEKFSGEEFDSAKHLMKTIQGAAGCFIDALHTADSIDKLIDINNEFYQMACTKC